MIEILLPKYSKQLIILCIVAYLLPTLSASVVHEKHLPVLIGGLLSILLFPIGYLMGQLVLRVQVINPFCPEKFLDFFCISTIYFFGGFSLIFGLIYPILLAFHLSSPEEMIINGIPAALGISYAAYKIREQFAYSLVEKSRGKINVDDIFIIQIRSWVKRKRILLSCLTIAVLLFVLLINYSLKNSDAYKLALRTAQSNTQITELLGSPIKPNFWVQGEVSTVNQEGYAKLNYKISGTKNTGELYVIAEKKNRDWLLKSLKFTSSNGETINLVGNE